MDPRAREIIEAWNRANSDRGTWMNHWQQITELCLPERNDYLVIRTPGMKRNQRVYNSTPIVALNTFANGLHSYLTSQAVRWFALHSDDDRLNKMQDVRLWFETVADALYSDFNGPRHNFASQSHELYLDIGSIGTAVMAVLESSRSGTLFTTRHLKECVLLENEEDRIDSVIRRWHYTGKQAYQAFGEKAGPAALKAYADGNDVLKFYFLHSVKPRLNPGQRLDAKGKAFESLYIAEMDGIVIDEGGFDEFPYLCPRFSKTTGEIYGRGPGMTMLPDMKMLNEAQKMVIKAAQKVVDPPLQIPDDGYLLPIKTVPGSQNFYRANSPQNARIMPIETKGRIDIGDEMISRLEQKIMTGFYADWIGMPLGGQDQVSAGKGITATWVLEERDKKMRLLSPMLARLQSEFLGPLIERDFAIKWRQSVRMRFGEGSPFPPPPAILSGRPWHIEYLSPIAIAQRSSQLDAVGRLVQQQLLLKQLNPNEIDIIDHEGVMRMTSEDLNAPAGVLKSAGRLKAEADQRAQAAQAQQAGEVASNMAGAARDGAAALQSFREAQH